MLPDNASSSNEGLLASIPQMSASGAKLPETSVRITPSCVARGVEQNLGYW